MATQLQDELATYEAHRTELLARGANRYVLIKSTDIVSILDTEMDAIREGYRRFGNVPMFVRQIVPVETPAFTTSSLVAL